jgi:hypothetical protein
VHEVTVVNAARWLFSLPVLMRLVALGHVKWAILEWILGSRQTTLDAGVRGTTLSSSLDPNETVIRAEGVSSGSPCGLELGQSAFGPARRARVRAETIPFDLAPRFGRIDRIRRMSLRFGVVGPTRLNCFGGVRPKRAR